MSQNSKIVNNFDWLTIAIYGLLIIMGWMNIYSSSFDGSAFEFGSRYGKQLIMIGVIIVFLIGFFFLNGHIIPTFSYIFYGFIILLLILVLLLGDKTGGSRSWFVIGSFKLQPSEFAKLATALMIAKVAGRENFKISKNIKSFFSIIGLIAFPALLILLQGDAGSALVFSAFIFVLYREGLSFWWIFVIFIEILVSISFFFLEIHLIYIFLTLIALIAYRFHTENKKESLFGFFLILFIVVIELAVVVLFRVNIELSVVIVTAVSIVIILSIIKHLKKMTVKFLIVPFLLMFYMGSVYSTEYVFENVLKSHQRARINVLFGIDNDITDIGYNVHQSKIAIGSGGLTGKGFLNGTQTKYDFVPEQDTDFIFCTVGEEWGFLGTTLVIIIFTILLFRLVYLAERQKSIFSRIFGYSLTSILFFHYSVNIAMTIGLAPVIGIPLPFFSYGGSSLFAFSIFLFIFLRLDSERNNLFA